MTYRLPSLLKDTAIATVAYISFRGRRIAKFRLLWVRAEGWTLFQLQRLYARLVWGRDQKSRLWATGLWRRAVLWQVANISEERKPCRWWPYIPPKRWQPHTIQHVVTGQKPTISIFTAVWTPALIRSDCLTRDSGEYLDVRGWRRA
jgi:hypothetical protein